MIVHVLTPRQLPGRFFVFAISHGQTPVSVRGIFARIFFDPEHRRMLMIDMPEIIVMSLRIFQAFLLLAAAGVILWLVCLIALPGLFNGPPFVGTGPGNLRAMMDLARLRPDELLIDLGSGDGRLLIAAARAGCRAVGYEMNPFLVLSSRLAVRRLGLQRRVRVVWGDFWQADLGTADVVTVFGFSTIMERLAAKFSAELKPGARVVSARYRLAGWPVAGQSGEVFLYVKGGVEPAGEPSRS